MSEKGHKGASLQEIANIVKIHKSTIFHYFKNKEEILLAVLERSIEEVTENLESIVKRDNLNPEVKFKEALRGHLELLVKYKDNVNVYHSEIRCLSPRKRHQYFNSRKQYAILFEEIIKEMQRANSGYFRKLDSKVVTLGVLGMCNWLVKWYDEAGPLTPKNVADTFYHMLVK